MSTTMSDGSNVLNVSYCTHKIRMFVIRILFATCTDAVIFGGYARTHALLQRDYAVNNDKKNHHPEDEDLDIMFKNSGERDAFFDKVFNTPCLDIYLKNSNYVSPQFADLDVETYQVYYHDMLSNKIIKIKLDCIVARNGIRELPSDFDCNALIVDSNENCTHRSCNSYIGTDVMSDMYKGVTKVVCTPTGYESDDAYSARMIYVLRMRLPKILRKEYRVYGYEDVVSIYGVTVWEKYSVRIIVWGDMDITLDDKALCYNNVQTTKYHQIVLNDLLKNIDVCEIVRDYISYY